jgi:hypothetical protein
MKKQRIISRIILNPLVTKIKISILAVKTIIGFPNPMMTVLNLEALIATDQSLQATFL